MEVPIAQKTWPTNLRTQYFYKDNSDVIFTLQDPLDKKYYTEDQIIQSGSILLHNQV